mmetsp:Transcript_5266/g.10702  ORF Transcript_5266/g.10702 Transcript_5266/m.10702 type:complete len:217 (+) Transcript_5266:2236-2886(+)
MRRGASTTWAYGASSAPVSPISSTTTASTTACCPLFCHGTRWRSSSRTPTRPGRRSPSTCPSRRCVASPSSSPAPFSQNVRLTPPSSFLPPLPAGHPSQRRRVSFRNGPLPQTLPDKRAGQDRPHPREDGRHLQFRGGPLAGLPLAGRGIPQSSRHRRHVSGSADLGDRALGRVGVEGGGRSRRFGPSFVNLSVTGFGVVCERTNIGCDGFVGGIK